MQMAEEYFNARNHSKILSQERQVVIYNNVISQRLIKLKFKLKLNYLNLTLLANS